MSCLLIGDIIVANSPSIFRLSSISWTPMPLRFDLLFSFPSHTSNKTIQAKSELKVVDTFKIKKTVQKKFNSETG
jgi:hypothetical protein